MRKLQLFGVLLLSTLFVAGGSAQNSSSQEKPVWTLEYLEIKPGMFGPAMGFLDDGWMRSREQARHDGSVLAFYRIAEEVSGDAERSVVLITEFKNQAAYDAHGKLFGSIITRLPQNSSGVIRGFGPNDLFQSVSTHTFQDFSESANPQFRLLSKM
jgi:hypothetical protein